MSARPGRRVALFLGLGGALSGCGFHPVYAPTSADGSGAAEALAAIDVKPIYERPGQILREALLGRFRTESGTPRHFDLQVTFWISGESQGILDFTQATRIRLVGQAAWSLSGHDPKHTKLAEGSERLIDGFDIFDSQYFALDLDNEAVQRRMAVAMAERITLRLAMWFNQHPTAMG
jgi:LPS-assembly lipoprotein